MSHVASPNGKVHLVPMAYTVPFAADNATIIVSTLGLPSAAGAGYTVTLMGNDSNGTAGTCSFYWSDQYNQQGCTSTRTLSGTVSLTVELVISYSGGQWTGASISLGEFIGTTENGACHNGYCPDMYWNGEPPGMGGIWRGGVWSPPGWAPTCPYCVIAGQGVMQLDGQVYSQSGGGPVSGVTWNGNINGNLVVNANDYSYPVPGAGTYPMSFTGVLSGNSYTASVQGIEQGS
jgi:hypothetical protein